MQKTKLLFILLTVLVPLLQCKNDYYSGNTFRENYSDGLTCSNDNYFPNNWISDNIQPNKIVQEQENKEQHINMNGPLLGHSVNNADTSAAFRVNENVVVDSSNTAIPSLLEHKRDNSEEEPRRSERQHGNSNQPNGRLQEQHSRVRWRYPGNQRSIPLINRGSRRPDFSHSYHSRYRRRFPAHRPPKGCVYCPQFIPPCRCPRGWKCFYIPRSCLNCQRFECVL